MRRLTAVAAAIATIGAMVGLARASVAASVLSATRIVHRGPTLEVHFGFSGPTPRFDLSTHGSELWIELPRTRIAIPPRPLFGYETAPIGSVRAMKGRVSTGDVPADLSGTGLAVMTLRLALDDTLATHSGIVTGRVVDEKGAPAPDTHIKLRGGQQSTVSSDSGTFTIRELPLGSQVLDVEKVGYPKMSTAMTVLGPQQPAVVAIALTPPRNPWFIARSLIVVVWLSSSSKSLSIAALTCALFVGSSTRVAFEPPFP